MQNVVFVPSCSESLSHLHKLGLEVYSVKLNGKPHVMVVTNQLRLMSDLAHLYGKECLYISDSKRQTYRLDLYNGIFLPTKIGTLARTTQDNTAMLKKDGNNFMILLVTQDNLNYYYSTH